MEVMGELLLRGAALDDVAAIHAIYSDQVLTGTASWEYDPPTLIEMTTRVSGILAAGFPYFVAEQMGAVVAYAYASSWRSRIGYRFTVEDSIYVREEHRGQGIGRVLLNHLLQACATAGYKHVIAVIGDSANVGSIKLHRACGFEHAATFKNVGYKFDRWLDSVQMQRVL